MSRTTTRSASAAILADHRQLILAIIISLTWSKNLPSCSALLCVWNDDERKRVDYSDA